MRPSTPGPKVVKTHAHASNLIPGQARGHTSAQPGQSSLSPRSTRQDARRKDNDHPAPGLNSRQRSAAPPRAADLKYRIDRHRKPASQ